MPFAENQFEGMKVLICPACKHYLGDAKCKAFPNGIPDVVYDEGHDQPVRGDKGFRFDPKD